MNADNWLEVATFLVIGVLFGMIRDTEENKTRDLRAAVPPARGCVQEARGACDPAHQHPGLHAVDPSLDHLRRDHGGAGRFGRDREPRGGAHARHLGVRDGSSADQPAVQGRWRTCRRRGEGTRRAAAAGDAGDDAGDRRGAGGARPGVDVSHARGGRYGPGCGRDARGRLGHQGADRPADSRRPAGGHGRAHRRRRTRGTQPARRHPGVGSVAGGRAVRRALASRRRRRSSSRRSIAWTRSSRPCSTSAGRASRRWYGPT